MRKMKKLIKKLQNRFCYTDTRRFFSFLFTTDTSKLWKKIAAKSPDTKTILFFLCILFYFVSTVVVHK